MLADGVDCKVINMSPQAAYKGEVEVAEMWAKKVPSGLGLISDPT